MFNIFRGFILKTEINKIIELVHFLTVCNCEETAKVAISRGNTKFSIITLYYTKKENLGTPNEGC